MQCLSMFLLRELKFIATFKYIIALLIYNEYVTYICVVIVCN